MSQALLEELDESLAAAERDAQVRAVVLTGTGTTFCAGADLKDPPLASDASTVSIPRILSRMLTFPKAVVARVNGHVRAGGTGLVAAADIAIAPSTASFAFSEVRIGVAPAIISVVCARTMTSRALHRFALTGETFDAETAVVSGLLTACVPPEELDAATEAILADIRLTEPNAVRETKALLASVQALGFDEGFTRAEAVSKALFRSPEAAEGMAAFREKRPPAWAR